MSDVLIINAHQTSLFSVGKLNAHLVDKASTLLEQKSHSVHVGTMQDGCLW